MGSSSSKPTYPFPVPRNDPPNSGFWSLSSKRKNKQRRDNDFIVANYPVQAYVPMPVAAPVKPAIVSAPGMQVPVHVAALRSARNRAPAAVFAARPASALPMHPLTADPLRRVPASAPMQFGRTPYSAFIQTPRRRVPASAPMRTYDRTTPASLGRVLHRRGPASAPMRMLGQTPHSSLRVPRHHSAPMRVAAQTPHSSLRVPRHHSAPMRMPVPASAPVPTWVPPPGRVPRTRPDIPQIINAESRPVRSARVPPVYPPTAGLPSQAAMQIPAPSTRQAPVPVAPTPPLMPMPRSVPSSVLVVPRSPVIPSPVIPRSDNPLPPPPQDVWNTSPYRQVLANLPAELPDLYDHQNRVEGPVDNPEPVPRPLSRAGSLFDRDRGKAPLNGLFRSRSAAGRSNVGADPNLHGRSRSENITTIVIPPPSVGTGAGVGASTSSAPTTMPVPTAGPSIKFDHTGEYAGFLNHSPHRVMYKNKTYPTALHLLEALKFAHKPALQERIRQCNDVRDMYPLSASFQKHVRPDWGQVFLKVMEDVLYLKFRQHPTLRALLLQTELVDIIYSDANTYWGDGLSGQGANELGKALVRLRERLRQEGEN